MQFNLTGIERRVVPFRLLEDIMAKVGFIRGGAWDYERVTYDFKFEKKQTGDVYYLRVPGVAVKGEIEGSNCIVKLGVPYLGHHYYPHGVEYDEVFPDDIVETSEERLKVLKETLEEIKDYVPET
jgi:hypothetical protein